MLSLFEVELEIENKNSPTSRSCVFAGLRQSSLLESFIWPAAMPTSTKYFVNIEFALIPFIGTALLCLRNYIVVRQWSDQARRTVDRCKEHLRAGGSIGIQLIGERTKDGRLGGFKKGPVVMAIESKSLLVPIAMYGAYECLPYGEWRIRPGKVRVVFEAAIDCGMLTYEQRNEVLDRLQTLAHQNFNMPNP